MELIKVDLQNISEEKLLEVIKQNIQTEKKMHKEMERLEQEKIKEKKEKEKTSLEEEQLEEISSYLSHDNDFEDEVDYYLFQLKNKEENLSIEEILPVRENGNYEKLLLRLIAESYKNIKEVKEFLKEEDLTVSDKEELEKEIIEERQRINQIEEQLKKPEVEQIEEKELNQLIFVPTMGGNIRLLEEIESIDKEYYPGFLKLVTSIEEGTFLHAKRFVASNNKTSGFCEVKDFKIRIVFDRLDKNKYALITAFIKKSDNDKGYIESLKRKIGEYKLISDTLKEKIKEDDFLEENQKYTEELKRRLGLEKEKQFVKKGLR